MKGNNPKGPSLKSEYLNMLEWSLDQQDHPVMILIPGNEVIIADLKEFISE